jgi:predicted nucleotidyltransferase
MDNRIIIKELKQILVNKFDKDINDVILFGSQLNGTAHKDSDIDVLIILNSDYNWKKKKEINNLCYEIDLKYDVFIDAQIISLNELQNSIRGKHPIFINAIKEGYHV